MAQTVREIMTPNPEWVSEGASAREVAQKMRDADAGAIPVCNNDGKLIGMVTDRDLALNVVAEGRSPDEFKVGGLAAGSMVTIAPDESVIAALDLMARYKVRRLPVVEDQTLVGIVSQGDVAVHLDDDSTGRLVEVISAAP